MTQPRVSLDQWRVLQAVADHGGFDAAAEALGRSQSAVSYAVQRLQEQLPVAVLAREGRRTVLTEAGRALLRRSRALVGEAAALEELAATLGQGWEAEIALAVDVICPPDVILPALAALGERSPQTRIDVLEPVLSGTRDAIVQRRVALAIGAQVPPGFLAEPLLEVEFVAVAHPDHPLHRLGRTVTAGDLRMRRQIVVRDTGPQRLDSGWLGAEQRWTVAHMRTSADALRRGLGFAWIPRDLVADDLASGHLRPLPLDAGGTRRATLSLVFVAGDAAGPGTRELAGLIREHARRYAAARGHAPADDGPAQP